MPKPWVTVNELDGFIVPELINRWPSIDVGFDHTKSTKMGFEGKGTNIEAFVRVRESLVAQKVFPISCGRKIFIVRYPFFVRYCRKQCMILKIS